MFNIFSVLCWQNLTVIFIATTLIIYKKICFNIHHQTHTIKFHNVLIYSHIIIYCSFIIPLILIVSMIIMSTMHWWVLYWRIGCFQCRLFFRIWITAFMFTIIIILNNLGDNLTIVAPNYSCIMLVNVL